MSSSSGKETIAALLSDDAWLWLRGAAAQFSLPDEGKAFRCCINFLAQQNVDAFGLLDAAGTTTTVAAAGNVSPRAIELAGSQLEWIRTTSSNAGSSPEVYAGAVVQACAAVEPISSIFAVIRCKTKTGAVLATADTPCAGAQAALQHKAQLDVNAGGGCACSGAPAAVAAPLPSIFGVPGMIESLGGADADRWHSIFATELLSGDACSVPISFLPKVTSWFGQATDADPAASALKRVQQQQILRLTNLLTCETACYNSLRVGRPQILNPDATSEYTSTLEKLYRDSNNPEKCDFCAYRERTAADAWGRVEGAHGCVSASNCAKAAGDHAVIILPGHHPLEGVSSEIVTDVLQTAQSWAQRTVDHNHSLQAGDVQVSQSAVFFPMLLWNAGLGSGATMPHGHAQAFVSEGRMSGRAEITRRAAATHQLETGRDYYDDLLRCHILAGLAVPVHSTAGGIAEPPTAYVLASLTPVASTEMLILGRTLPDGE